MGTPVPSALQTRAVASEDAVTMRLPSGLHAADVTLSEWPLKTMGAPVPSAFQTRAVPSADAVTMYLLSGLHDAELTRSSWPLRATGPNPSAFQTHAVLS